MAASEAAYSWCERVTATPTSPVHIREVGPEGIQPGGGIPEPGLALCGGSVARGWDIRPDVAESVDRMATIAQDQPGRVCLRCVERYREAQP